MHLKLILEIEKSIRIVRRGGIRTKFALISKRRCPEKNKRYPKYIGTLGPNFAVQLTSKAFKIHWRHGRKGPLRGTKELKDKTKHMFGR